MRPPTWVASFCPVLIATVWVYFHTGLTYARTGMMEFWLMVDLLLLACLSMQIACNFTNDYYDHRNGVDNETRKGPRRLLQENLVAPEKFLKVTIFFYLIAVVIGLYYCYLIWQVDEGGSTRSLLLLGFVLVSTWVGYAYTGGPFPLGYHGLGDLMAWWFFGPGLVIALTYIMVFSGLFDREVLDYFSLTGKTANLMNSWGEVFLVGLGPGFFSLSLLNINNLRDLEDDRRKGKKTLAVRMGKSLTKFLLLVYLLGGVFSILILSFRKIGWRWEYLVFLLCLPLLMTVVVSVLRESNLNIALKKTGILYLLQSVMAGYCIYLFKTVV